MTLTAALAALAVSAFVSATLFPGASEAGIAALALEWPDAWPAALAVASVANTAGSLTSVVIGRVLPNRQQENTALAKLRQYGSPLLFFSWLPVVGDALPLAAGWLRLPWAPVIFWTALGKTLRYATVLATLFGVLPLF